VFVRVPISNVGAASTRINPRPHRPAGHEPANPQAPSPICFQSTAHRPPPTAHQPTAHQPISPSAHQPVAPHPIALLAVAPQPIGLQPHHPAAISLQRQALFPPPARRGCCVELLSRHFCPLTPAPKSAPVPACAPLSGRLRGVVDREQPSAAPSVAQQPGRGSDNGRRSRSNAPWEEPGFDDARRAPRALTKSGEVRRGREWINEACGYAVLPAIGEHVEERVAHHSRGLQCTSVPSIGKQRSRAHQQAIDLAGQAHRETAHAAEQIAARLGLDQQVHVIFLNREVRDSKSPSPRRFVAAITACTVGNTNRWRSDDSR
jgi:hypothetical protein